MPLPIALDYRPALLSRTGIGRVARELARALAARDDLVVHLYGHSLARARVAAGVPAGARLHRLPIPGRLLPALRRIGLGADRLAGRVPVFHWLDYVDTPVSRARAVLTIHDLAFARDPAFHGAGAAAVLAARTRRALGAATAVVVPSRATAADLAEFAPGAPPPRIVPFGADHVPSAGAPHPLGGRDYAICVGTVEPRKNHLGLLAAWRQLPAPRPLLVVAGSIGWQCDGIAGELAAAARDGFVDWRRDVDDVRLWQLVQHARIAVYPSLWEGFGLPPLEAMASGVPVVAHAAAPLAELGDGAMLLVDCTDADALAAAVLQLWRDDAERDRRGTAGRRRAAAFRWADCAAAHAALYREVAG